MILELGHRWADGTTHLVFDPVELAAGGAHAAPADLDSNSLAARGTRILRDLAVRADILLMPGTRVLLFMALLVGGVGGVCVVTTAGQPPAPPLAGVPTVRILKPPDFWGQYAIWGATGFNRAGRIFFGMTSNDDRGAGSAHLFEFDPTSGTFADRGSVVEELERLGIRRPGETQMKIHSRIVQATDGFLYFSSMDETGEVEDGSTLPTWGGHLWRRGPSGRWEHLTATPEALIAVAAGGPYVYALGYFNHVLYQFHMRTGRIRSVAVGAAGGHVSRNFFVDDRGHAFVSRVTRSAPDKGAATLVELDPNLVEIGSQRLDEYFESVPDDSHGIVATVPNGARGWFFTTGKGRLYHEEPRPVGPAAVTDLGWVHPAGPRYPASLFRDEQTGSLYAVAMPSHNGGRAFDWIVRTPAGRTTVAPFPYGETREFPGAALVYGSMTRDAAGRFYVVGTMNHKPVILQVTPGR